MSHEIHFHIPPTHELRIVDGELVVRPEQEISGRPQSFDTALHTVDARVPFLIDLLVCPNPNCLKVYAAPLGFNACTANCTAFGESPPVLVARQVEVPL